MTNRHKAHNHQHYRNEQHHDTRKHQPWHNEFQISLQIQVGLVFSNNVFSTKSCCDLTSSFSVVIRVDEQGRPERNREVYLFNLGQKLDGTDADGNEAKLFGIFPVVRWDKRWSSKQKSTVFYSCRVLSKRVLFIKVPGYDYGMLYGMKYLVMEPDSVCKEGIESGAKKYDNSLTGTPDCD